MLLIDELLLHLAIFAEICIKMRYFYRKIAKIASACGFPSRPPPEPRLLEYATAYINMTEQ